jgi:copper chaperone CopZ
MKKILFILLLIPIFSFSQEEKSKTTRAQFTVLGECEMCKDRIEKATFKIKGVKYSSWSIPKNKLSIIYNSNKVSLNDIKKQIAETGHDTDEILATDEAYENLHHCCKYRDL